MSALRDWWSQPTDYAWNVHFSQSHPILAGTRVAIGVCCFLYGVICVLALSSPIVTSNSIESMLIAAFGVSTVVVGIAWLRGPWPGYGLSLAFVAYAEVGVTGVLLSLDDPTVSLLCAALLGVMGNYVAAFHNSRVFLSHQLWALATCLILYARAVTATGTSVEQATAYLVLLVMVVVSSPILTQAYLTYLRRDAVVAHFDPLTGLRNRRGLESALGSLRHGEAPVCVLVADLDNFKTVNDTFGHSYGDDVLRRTSVALGQVFPPPAVTARTGGEEFVAVLVAPLPDMVRAAEQLKDAIPACNAEGRTTTSIGIHHRSVPLHEVGAVFEELLRGADTAMYEAKRHGGNSVVVHGYDDGARTSS